METKVCSKCGETKSLEEFYLYKESKRPKGTCRACDRKATKAWEAKGDNKTRLHAWRKQYRQDHLEQYRAYWKKNYDNGPGVSVYRGMRNRHAKRFAGDTIIPKEDFLTWHSQPNKKCYYCEIPLERVHVDRMDNAIGYTKENIVFACRACNLAKLDIWSAEIFKKHIGPAIKAAREENVLNGNPKESRHDAVQDGSPDI